MQEKSSPVESTIYVLLNTDLKMSPGKAAAQAVHAAMLFNANSRGDFLANYRRTVIVLGATGEQIKNMYIYLEQTDIDADYYIDEGVNEVEAYSVTALAAFVSNPEDRKIFAPFDLYGKSRRWLL